MIAILVRAEPAPNAPRFRGTPGHVESYFLRANDPSRPRALWLKETILAPLDGPTVAETWFIWFDGDANRTFACKQTLPFDAAMFHATDEGAEVHLGDWALTLAARGAGKGSVRSGEQTASFDLRFGSAASPVAEPLSIYPWRVLREGAFPKSKLLTPSPWLTFSGSVTVPRVSASNIGASSDAFIDDATAAREAAAQRTAAQETISLDGWVGMQGHNWGKEHAFEYAWGQCLFPAVDGAPETMVEGFSGRVKVGGRTSPQMSAAVVRRGAREYRFDRVFDFWRQEAHVTSTRWTLRLTGPDATMRLRMDATTRPFACLGYESPDHSLAYCFNSKLAEVLLEVTPRDAAPFTCRSAHGGALELLRREPDSRLSVV